jgi:hypothetical protein
MQEDHGGCPAVEECFALQAAGARDGIDFTKLHFFRKLFDKF